MCILITTLSLGLVSSGTGERSGKGRAGYVARRRENGETEESPRPWTSQPSPDGSEFQER